MARVGELGQKSKGRVYMHQRWRFGIQGLKAAFNGVVSCVVCRMSFRRTVDDDEHSVLLSRNNRTDK